MPLTALAKATHIEQPLQASKYTLLSRGLIEGAEKVQDQKAEMEAYRRY